MKVSAHRYRQSRQGATVASSRWTKAVIVASVLALNLLIALFVLMLQAHP